MNPFFTQAGPVVGGPLVGSGPQQLLLAAEHVRADGMGGAGHGHADQQRDADGQVRHRVSKACDPCSKRRARCTGTHPCERCASKGIVCTYDRSSKKRGPAKGSVMSVHKRLKALEELVLSKGVSPEALTRLGLDLGDLEGADGDGAGASGSVSGDEGSDGDGNVDVDGENGRGVGADDTSATAGRDAAERAASSSRRASARPAKRRATGLAHHDGGRPTGVGSGGAGQPDVFAGGGGTFTFASPPGMAGYVAGTTTTTVAGSAPGGYSALYPPPLPLPQLQPLPPQEVLDDLVKTWLVQILPMSGNVHRPSLQRSPFSYPPQFLLSTFCFAAKLSSHPWINNPPVMTSDICGQIFYDHAMRLLIPVLIGLQVPTVYDVLSVINCAFYPYAGMYAGSNNPEKMNFAFRFLGFAVAIAREISLNRERPDALEGNWISKEHRRRVFWNLVMVDRVLSAASNSEPLIAESEMHCDLPCLDAIWESDDATLARPDNIPVRRAIAALDEPEELAKFLGSNKAGPGAYLALLNVMFGRIIVRHCLQQTDDAGKKKLDAELENWMNAVPARVRELRINPNEPVQPGRILDSRISFVFILWHTLKIMLHGPWDPISMAKDTKWLLSPDFLVCAEHAEHISRTVEFIMKSSVAPDFLPPYLGLCVLMAAFVHINLLKKLKGTGELEDDLRRRILIYTDCLDQIGSRWRPVLSIAGVLRQALGSTVGSNELAGDPRVTGNWGSGGRGLFSLAELAQEKVEEESEQLGSSSHFYAQGGMDNSNPADGMNLGGLLDGKDVMLPGPFEFF